MRIVTNSRLRSFRACRRQHHYRYDLLRRPINVRRPLALGTLIHAALEAWWTWYLGPTSARLGGEGDWDRVSYATALDAAWLGLERAQVTALEESEDVSAFDIAAVQRLIVGYDARWRLAMESDYEVLGVEMPFTALLVNPETGRKSQTYLKAGKLDVVLRRRADGRIVFMEHKSTASSLDHDSTYWQKLRMDPQVSTYYDGLAALGFVVDVCVYDVIRKPTLEPRLATPVESREYTQGKGCKICGGKTGKAGSGLAITTISRVTTQTSVTPIAMCSVCSGTGWAEAPRLYAKQRENDETPEEYGERIAVDIAERPNFYYAQAEVVRIDSEMVEHNVDTWQTTKSLYEVSKFGRHARNPDACFAFGSACEYYAVCTGAASIDDEHLFRTAQNEHEELGADASLISAAELLRKVRAQGRGAQ